MSIFDRWAGIIAWWPVSIAPRHPILGRVVFYSLVVLVLVPLMFSHVMTRPFRQPTNPPRGGFTSGHVVSEGLKLRTWTRPGSRARPAVVIVHGVGDSLESFLGHGLEFAARGHTVLLLDTRGHGGSEGGRITLGAREREDVRAAMDRLRGDGMAASGLLLIGHSMGAVAVLRAAAGQPDVSAVIVEAPYDTFRETIARHAVLFYRVPRWVPLIPLSIALTEWRAGFDADEVDAMAAAARATGALLAIADGADLRMPEAVVRRVFDAHPGPKRMWVAPHAGHLGASLHPDYWPTVESFLVENGI
jgi:pimeloyl-ACP methyl ester carboxylesterase